MNKAIKTIITTVGTSIFSNFLSKENLDQLRNLESDFNTKFGGITGEGESESLDQIINQVKGVELYKRSVRSLNK